MDTNTESKTTTVRRYWNATLLTVSAVGAEFVSGLALLG